MDIFDQEPPPEVVAYVGNMMNKAWLDAVRSVLGTDEERVQRIAALAGFNMLAEVSNEMRAFLTSEESGGSLDDLSAEDIARLFEGDDKKEK